MQEAEYVEFHSDQEAQEELAEEEGGVASIEEKSSHTTFRHGETQAAEPGVAHVWEAHPWVYFNLLSSFWQIPHIRTIQPIQR